MKRFFETVLRAHDTPNQIAGSLMRSGTLDSAKAHPVSYLDSDLKSFFYSWELD